MGNTQSSCEESPEDQEIIKEALADLQSKLESPNGWKGVKAIKTDRLQNQSELNPQILESKPVDDDPYSNPKLQGFSSGDNRRRIPEEMLVQHPYLPIGFLTMTFNQVATNYGTGTVIAPNIVLTCAHNCWDHFFKKQAKRMHFFLYINGKTGQSNEVIKMIYPKEFQKVYKPENDYAILILKHSMDKNFGYLGVSYGVSKSPLQVKVIGFPYSIQYEGKKYQGQKIMFEADGQAKITDKEKGIIDHVAATSGGQSGGPILQKVGDNEYEVIGVHLAQKKDGTTNFGILMMIKHYIELKKMNQPSKDTSLTYNYNDADLSQIQNSNKKSISLRQSLINLKQNQQQKFITAIKNNDNIIGVDLSMNQFRDLRASCFNTNLVSLNLSFNRINKRFFHEMNQLVWPNLKTLSLHHNQIQNDDTTTMKSSKFPLLETLIISMNVLTWKFLLNLGKEKHKNLMNLYLGGNVEFFAEDPKNLAECEFPKLKTLDLHQTGIKSVSSVKEIAKMKMPLLYELDLSDNQITAQMVAQLKPFAKIISSLNLNNNKLQKQGIIKLVIGQFSSLRSLHLKNNQIDNSALESLAGASFLPKLKILSLDSNKITSEGLKKLLKRGENLKHMTVSDNNLEDFNPRNYNFRLVTESLAMN